MVRLHLKWLSMPLAALAIVGGWTLPVEAGIIPWTYNAVFGPARNGPNGGAAYYASRGYGASTFAGYGPVAYGGMGYGGCSTGGCGAGAGYGYSMPAYSGYDAGCGSCSPCGTGNCGTSAYGGYSSYAPVGSCGTGCNVANSCTPNAPAGAGLTPIPAQQYPAQPAGVAPQGGAIGNGFTGAPPMGTGGYNAPMGPGGYNPQANPAGAPPAYDAGAPGTFAPAGPAGSGRVAPESDFRAPASRPTNPLNESTNGTSDAFRPVTPVPPATPAPVNPSGAGTTPVNPIEEIPEAKPASAPTKPQAAPAIRDDDDANLGPVARDEQVAKVAFDRVLLKQQTRDARLVRVDTLPTVQPLATVARK
jgi:hypothetical protein